jgi:glycosyltransferase involved in cell wall biosynthesis
MSEFTTKSVATVAADRLAPRVGGYPRVLYVASSDNDGGIERHSARLAGQLVERGVPVAFACRAEGIVAGLAHGYGVPTIPHHPRNSGDIVSAFALAWQIVRGRFDIVHVHSRRDFVPGIAAVWLARGFDRKRPIKLALHVHLVRRLANASSINNWAFGAVTDRIVAVSSAVRNVIVADKVTPDDHVKVITNGVDFSAYAEPGSLEAEVRRDRVRDRWGVAYDAPVIGMVGRLDAKGQRTLLDQMPKLLEHIPDLRLVLVGPDGHKGDGEWFAAEARERAIEKSVIVAGPTNDVPSAMAGFDVLAHLPADEAFGSVLPEAMAAGLPVVSSDAGGCPEIVRDGVTGTVIPLGDNEALVDAILSLFDPVTGANLRRTQGENEWLVRITRVSGKWTICWISMTRCYGGLRIDSLEERAHPHVPRGRG